jgi:hypothetical protein
MWRRPPKRRLPRQRPAACCRASTYTQWTFHAGAFRTARPATPPAANKLPRLPALRRTLCRTPWPARGPLVFCLCTRRPQCPFLLTEVGARGLTALGQARAAPGHTAFLRQPDYANQQDQQPCPLPAAQRSLFMPSGPDGSLDASALARLQLDSADAQVRRGSPACAPLHWPLAAQAPVLLPSSCPCRRRWRSAATRTRTPPEAPRRRAWRGPGCRTSRRRRAASGPAA